jgi:hypothetical protein
MITLLPSSFCSDEGRAIIHAAAPPINKPTEWNGWKECQSEIIKFILLEENLRSGGFKFMARVINYPGGELGDIGLLFS